MNSVTLLTINVLVAAGVVWFWDSVLLQPIKALAVTTHETCHAIAVVITGGTVLEVSTLWNESGHTLSSGGWYPIIASAGYVGTAAVGSLLIASTVRPAAQRVVLLLYALLLMGVYLIGASLFNLGFWLAMIAGGGILWSAIMRPSAVPYIANILGSVLCLYSLHDFRTDLWQYPEKTDAGLLANYWGMAWLAVPIATVWIIISVLFMCWSLWKIAKKIS